ncbi:uncharacterized protein [Macrobrachium rosenbergii]|uniref:uncharacterized protein n=1 Tax=Macrobrachium rosenbergii TaxID=79674 RepID=UPI0034D6BB6A
MDSSDLEGTTSKMFEGNNTEGSVEFKKNQVDLSFGLDLSDDAILREGPSSGNLSLSLVFERRKLTKTFKLTPVLQEPKQGTVKTSDSKEEEVLDLTTPQQGITINHGTSCPERPVKSHKLVLPSAEKSCRHLFTEESCHFTLDSDFEPGKQKELGQASYRKHESESKEKVKETDDVCDEEENLGKTTNPEDGNQSSFSCTLSTCSKSSCDVTSCTSSPCLSSPNLSKIKGAKRTIESSSSDVEIQLNEDRNSQTSVLEDQELESHCQDGDLFISPSVSQKPQVSSDAANKVINNVVSSTDGTPSNWTLVSGVSPLPSSDPSHLQHYFMHRIHHHHHHHCHHHNHHHHHHHNHHHHHHWHQKNKENCCNRANSTNVKLPENFSEDGPVLTSTPIRLKAAVNNLDVSSIKNRRSMDEVVGDFVISSELQVSDSLSRSITYASDDEENSGIIQQRNIDDTNHSVKRLLAICHYSEDEASDKKLKVSAADLDLSKYKNKFAGQTPYVRRLTKEEVELLNSKPENFSDEVWYKSPSPLEGLPGSS